MTERSEEVLFENRHWITLLADDQLYVGRSVVILKSPCSDLSRLTQEQLMFWHRMVLIFESTLRKTLGADLFNWTCLMNHAFRKKPWDPQVHWHVRPRYSKPVVFPSITFRDPNFGEHYLEGRKQEVIPSVRAEIVARITEE